MNRVMKSSAVEGVGVDRSDDSRELMLSRAALIKLLYSFIRLDAADSARAASNRSRSTLEEDEEMLRDEAWLVDILELTSSSEASMEDDEVTRLTDEAR